VLTIGGLAPKEIRVIRLRDALEKSFISFLEWDELRILVSGFGQRANVMMVPGGKCRGSEDDRVKCYEGSAEKKRLAKHAGEDSLMGWKMEEMG
jgi:hypothetical protein